MQSVGFSYQDCGKVSEIDHMMTVSVIWRLPFLLLLRHKPELINFFSTSIERGPSKGHSYWVILLPLPSFCTSLKRKIITVEVEIFVSLIHWSYEADKEKDNRNNRCCINAGSEHTHWRNSQSQKSDVDMSHYPLIILYFFCLGH